MAQSVLLHDLSEKTYKTYLTASTYKILGISIRQAVLLSQKFSQSLSQTISTIEQNMAREEFELHFYAPWHTVLLQMAMLYKI